MKRIFNLIIAILCLSDLLAQQIVMGRVIDKATRDPLELAYIRHKDGNAITDKLGNFALMISPSIAGDTVIVNVSYIGYQSRLISIPFGSEPIIELERGILNLQEVVVLPQAAASSFKTISQIDLNLQPVRSAQDILRTVPGLFIGQHQGGGKAEQIFLRGFDIDHGTDINVTVDGLPVNMVSHAHGQGYADLHFLIPELTGKVDYGKGPYYTQFGNLGTAGYVSLHTMNTLDRNVIKIEGGQFNTLRGLAMIGLLSKKQKEKGTNAYIAGELLYSDGPSDAPQHFNRFNLFGKFNTKLGSKNKLTIIGSALSSDWDASGQIPERAVKDGTIGRFGYIDSTEGGYTARYNASISLSSYFRNNNSWENQLYYTRYHFNLHSNFSFFLNDPVNGDQIRQREARDIWGYQSKFTRNQTKSRWKIQTIYSAGFRYDATYNSELSNTVNRNTILEYVQLGDIRELNAFTYVDKSFERGPWLLNAGARLDYFNFSYANKLYPDPALAQEKVIVTPKLNIQYTFSKTAQLYFKAGKGFHSNDARVVVMNEGKEILPAAYGMDLGVILKPTSKLLISAAAWYLFLQQEFVYVGDEGIVEPSGKTSRIGIDLSGRYQLNRWLFADLNINLARPRGLETEKGNNYIPLAPLLTSTGGISFQMKKGWNGSLRYRHIADRPANEDNSIVAKGYTVTDLSINYTRKYFEIGVAIENLFDIEWNETQFDTESRLKDEPAPVSEIHFTPGVPFFARIKLAVFF